MTEAMIEFTKCSDTVNETPKYREFNPYQINVKAMYGENMHQIDLFHPTLAFSLKNTTPINIAIPNILCFRSRRFLLDRNFF